MTTDSRALALASYALTYWGGVTEPPRLIKNRENIVFEVHLADGSHAALRLHRPGYQSRAAIEAELRWTADLVAQGLPVPAPIPAHNGRLTVRADDRIVTCVQWLDGLPIGSAEAALAGTADQQSALMHRLGALVARVHNASPTPDRFERPTWDAVGFLGERPLWGRFWENPSFDAAELTTVQAARAQARDTLAELRLGGLDYGPIHADVLRENVLDTGTTLALIDFDDCGMGFRLYDLATALFQSLEEPHLPDLAAALLEGYRTHRPLGPQSAHQLALFVMLRSFASAGWIITRAAPDDPRQAFYAERATRMADHVLAGTAPWGVLA